ncbi:hypothetical protein FOA52_000165 [Chlamydomonas sp. UWO 241]|nr:hypothetical protein FOA52_000165 [Chlamydomonas sp. UWO 241]
MEELQQVSHSLLTNLQELNRASEALEALPTPHFTAHADGDGGSSRQVQAPESSSSGSSGLHTIIPHAASMALGGRRRAPTVIHGSGARDARSSSSSSSSTSTSTRASTSTQRAASDSPSALMRSVSGVCLLTAHGERALTGVVHDAQFLERIRSQLSSILRRAPSPTEWARAVRASEHELHARLALGAAAKSAMLQANYRLVTSVVRRYQGHGLSLPDLFLEGLAGLRAGIERFDVARGCRLSTYATWWIRAGVTDALSNQTRRPDRCSGAPSAVAS